MKIIFLAISLICICGCNGIKEATATGYLGIPDQAEYPEKGSPCSEIKDKFYAVTKVKTMDYDEYLWYKKKKLVHYETRHGNTVHFCSIFKDDTETRPAGKDFVLILERWKTTAPNTKGLNPVNNK